MCYTYLHRTAFYFHDYALTAEFYLPSNVTTNADNLIVISLARIILAPLAKTDAQP